MDHKMLSLGRAKKKLCYIQTEENNTCMVQIKDVFTLDNFDDLDSASGLLTSKLSPLRSSEELFAQERASHSPNFKPSSFFGAEKPEVFAQEDCSQEDDLNGKESPFKEIAPINTSSPIDLVPAGNGTEDTEKPKTTVILFGVEEEEAIRGDLSKPPLRPESPKEFLQEHSESLVSPPARLEFGKLSTKNAVSVKSCIPVQHPAVPAQGCHTSTPETREGPKMDGSPNCSSLILVQNNSSESLPEENPKNQVPEKKLDIEVKESSFQKQLRNVFQPKTSLKPKAQKQQVRAPSPLELEEDFMIMEDDAPVLFTIPRKAETCQKEKQAPGGVSAKPDSKTAASQVESASLKLQEDEKKHAVKTKAKRGKTSELTNKDTEVQTTLEERIDHLNEGNEEVAVCETSPVPDASKEANIPGKQKRSKTSWRQENALNMKKKPTKTKSAANVVTVDHTQASAKQSKHVKKSNKQHAVKLKGAVRVKKVEKTKIDAKMKKIPVAEPSVSAEGPLTAKRKRKQPGEWWVTSNAQNEANTQEHEVTVQQSLPVLKCSTKKKKKEAPTISVQGNEEKESQRKPNKPANVQKVANKVKTSKCTIYQKNSKTVGGRGKQKPSVPTQQGRRSKIPAPEVGEEAAVNEIVGQLSPAACTPPPRQRSLTPGEKRVFDKIYKQKSRSKSAQKSSSSAVHQPESLLGKRQRKPPSHWWEVPRPQESVESSCSPLNCSPRKSKPQMAPSSHGLDKIANVASSVVITEKRNKIDMIQTPKSVKRSLATFDALPASGKPASSTVRGLKSRPKGRRNLLHSLEEQSELSSENIHSDQQHGSSHATFDVCTSGVTEEPLAGRKRTDARLSAASHRASDGYGDFKSGPSSMIELERYEDHEDSDFPSTRIIPLAQHIPRVLLECDFCGPPLQPIVLETEDWDNLSVWFAQLWPLSSKDGKIFSVISPDDFHWHSFGGRAMGHMVDLQNNTFSNGKLLLGSYMKKPPQVDLHAVTVFNVVSSCVRVDIEGIKTVYNSGQAFMTSVGQSYSIHNVCREPAVLWYHRMSPNHTMN